MWLQSFILFCWELTLLVYLVLQELVLQASVPLRFCITCWPCGYSVQVEKNPADPGENKSMRQAVLEEREKAHFEAGDALLTLPIESSTGMLLLHLLCISSISQRSVSNTALVREFLLAAY